MVIDEHDVGPEAAPDKTVDLRNATQKAYVA
jgi:hypothetical protein